MISIRLNGVDLHFVFLGFSITSESQGAVDFGAGYTISVSEDSQSCEASSLANSNSGSAANTPKRPKTE
jgi:hypothetical protein